MSTDKTLGMEAVAELENYAKDHYEEGGHWVFETYNLDAYIEVLTLTRGNVPEAKKMLRDNWTRINERAKECAFGDGEY